MLAGAKLKITLCVFLLSHNVIACMYMALVGRALDKPLSGLFVRVSEAGGRLCETWCCISCSIFHVNISA